MNYLTIGDLLTACAKCKTERDADDVLRKAQEDNPNHAAENIGYILGYLESNERDRLYPLFPTCNHPIFGKGFGRGENPSPEEAFTKGKELGEKLKAKRVD